MQNLILGYYSSFYHSGWSLETSYFWNKVWMPGDWTILAEPFILLTD